MQVLVLGCGVSGLSCAIRLREAGHTVEVWARELPPHTTSNVAAAVWYPYRAFPQERVIGWGQRTYEVLSTLAGHPETGVQLAHGVEVFTEEPPDPWWAPCVPSFRRARPEELPPGYPYGYFFEAPVIEMPRYLPPRRDGRGGKRLAPARRLAGRGHPRALCATAPPRGSGAGGGAPRGPAAGPPHRAPRGGARGRTPGPPQLRPRRRGRHPLLGLRRGGTGARRRGARYSQSPMSGPALKGPPSQPEAVASAATGTSWNWKMKSLPWLKKNFSALTFQACGLPFAGVSST